MDKIKLDSESVKEMVKKAVMKLGPQVSKEDKQEHAKILMRIFDKGMLPKDAICLSKRDMSQLYTYAYYLFNSGKYPQAREMFKLLLALDPSEVGFATALGICYHREKNYKFALTAYLRSYLQDPFDPLPLFYGYDCAIKMDSEPVALMLLKKTIEAAGDQTKFAAIKERAQLIYDGLEPKVKKNAGL